MNSRESAETHALGTAIDDDLSLLDLWEHLLIEKSPANVASQRALPGYVYSSSIARRRLQFLQSHFPGFSVLLSVKANPNVELLKALAVDNPSLDLSSRGEVELAVTTGADMSRAALVGPGKNSQLLRYAIEMGIGTVVLESEREVLSMSELLKKSLTMPSMMVRVNPMTSFDRANEIMGGRPSQFGIDEEEFPRLIKVARDLGIRISGLHFFLGSQIRTLQGHRTNVRSIIGCVKRLSPMLETSGEPFRINMGGGFGLSHDKTERAASLRSIAPIYEDAVRRMSLDLNCRVIPFLESGRWIFGPAGVFLTRVLEVKRSRETQFVILESGVSGFSRPAFRWGEVHPMWILGKRTSGRSGTYTVVGPTCLPGDTLGSDVKLRDPQPGDTLVVGLAGAYGHSMSAHDWGSLEFPREVIID